MYTLYEWIPLTLLLFVLPGSTFIPYIIKIYFLINLFSYTFAISNYILFLQKCIHHNFFRREKHLSISLNFN